MGIVFIFETEPFFSVISDFDYVFSENGLVAYQDGTFVAKQVIILYSIFLAFLISCSEVQCCFLIVDLVMIFKCFFFNFLEYIKLCWGRKTADIHKLLLAVYVTAEVACEEVLLI